MTTRRQRSLTPRQREILAFVVGVTKARMYVPSLREIAERFNITVHAAYCHLNAIMAKGYLTKAGPSLNKYVPTGKAFEDYRLISKQP